METIKKKFAGVAIVFGVIAATTVVYARTTQAAEVFPPSSQDHPPAQISRSFQAGQTSAIAVDGNDIFVLDGNNLIQVDRKTLQVVKSQQIRNISNTSAAAGTQIKEAPEMLKN